MLWCHTCIYMHTWVCRHAFNHTQTHKQGCCSSNLLCNRADVTAHHHHWSRPAPQKTGRAQPSGPVVWSETHRRVTETGRRREDRAVLMVLTFRLWAVNWGALQLIQKTLRALWGFRVHVLLVWTRLLQLWQSTCQILSVDDKDVERTREDRHHDKHRDNVKL